MKNTNRLNRVDFDSTRDFEMEQEQLNETSAEWTTAQSCEIECPAIVERVYGWNDIEIIEIQIDKKGIHAPRIIAQCIGNKHKNYRFALYQSFINECQKKGFLPKNGTFDLCKLIGQKFQVNFAPYQVIDDKGIKNCFKVLEVQEFTL